METIPIECEQTIKKQTIESLRKCLYIYQLKIDLGMENNKTYWRAYLIRYGYLKSGNAHELFGKGTRFYYGEGDTIDSAINDAINNVQQNGNEVIVK